jgi:hypothetical protein
MAKLTKKEAKKELERQNLWIQIESLGKISKECTSEEAQEHIEKAIKILMNHPIITGQKS